MKIRIIIKEYIKHENGKYNVYSHKGKRMGSYDSEKEAKHRLQQIEYFKHLDEDKDPLDKPTMTPEQLAKHHGVNISVINAQLAKGIKIEQEHTSHPGIAREIALDHIKEKVDYYNRLEKAENE